MSPRSTVGARSVTRLLRPLAIAHCAPVAPRLARAHARVTTDQTALARGPLSLVVGEPMDQRVDATAGDDAHMAAFDALVHKLYAPLCRAAFRITASHDTAEDVVTEALAAFWNRRAHIRWSVSVRSYLYRAVRNRALDAMRRDRNARHVPLEEADAVPDDRPGAVPTEPIGDLERALERVVAALPERCRLVYVLCREEGMTYAEVADVLGISVKTVDAQLCRAVTRIRSALALYLG